MKLNFNRRFRLYRFLVFLFAVLTEANGYALVDLESSIQNFVLETKKIEIPNYSDALNPSIIRVNDTILMCFRIRDPLTSLTNRIGLMWMDEEFNALSTPQILQMETHEDIYFSRTQDPRLIKVGADLFIVFNEYHQTSRDPNRRMAYSKIIEKEGIFFAERPTYLLNFENENPGKQEKNWVPFNYNNELFLAYSIDPHFILKPISNSTSCQNISQNSSNIKWKWGVLRGGTPAEKIGDQYLAFFHSVKDMVTLQSKGQRIIHYFMGAYTFNSSPPFNITHMSPEPIIGNNFYNGPTYKTWKPLLVVFPGGFIFDENFIWIAYGRQDHEAWVVKLDKRGLFNSLIPVSSRP